MGKANQWGCARVSGHPIRRSTGGEWLTLWNNDPRLRRDAPEFRRSFRVLAYSAASGLAFSGSLRRSQTSTMASARRSIRASS
jgi:hypothetical protein